MFSDAVAAKLEEAARLMASGLEHAADAIHLLRGAPVGKQKRAPRPRAIPAPSRPVTELEQARAERVLKKHGFLVGEE
ncbi:MAG: hypothetical protein ABI548_01010 [Polyangiaceae bacterium]